MRKVLLIHISSGGCCNPLVTMLNNGDFWLSILFQSRVFHPCSLVPRFPLPRFQRPLSCQQNMHSGTLSISISLNLQHFDLLSAQSSLQHEHLWLFLVVNSDCSYLAALQATTVIAMTTARRKAPPITQLNITISFVSVQQWSGVVYNALG